MASFKDLILDWSMLPEDTAAWELEDLQLAAQLAKNFLKRNEELAEDILNLQKVLDDQERELKHFKNLNSSLREMGNECHSRIFQLEAQVEDLIKIRDEINVECKKKRKQNNELHKNIQRLNQRCEELEGNLEKVTRERNDLLKTNLRHQKEIKENIQTSSSNKTSEFGENFSFHEPLEEYSPKVLPEDISLHEIKNENSDINEEFMEEIKEIASVLRSEKSKRIRLEQHSVELEERLSTFIQENKRLKNMINEKSGGFESKFDSQKTYLVEVNAFGEVRLELCSYCLQIVKNNDNESFLQLVDEYNEISIENPNIDAQTETHRYRSSLHVLIGENGEIIDKQN